MLVIKNPKAVVVKTHNPRGILSAIPSSKIINLGGQELVAVKHGLDEVKVLRNIGFKAPGPMKYHYDWPGRFSPFRAQKETSDFLSIHQRAYCLNDIGTGKTLSVLWAYDYLKQQGKVNKLLVVSPLSTLERTWADEIFKNFSHLSFVVLHGSKTKRLKLLKEDADVYIVNHHGAKIIQEEIKDRGDINLVVVDEIAQAARNASTDIWKALNNICNKQLGGTRRVWGLTGTPTPNLPTDAWAQCRLVTPETVPKYARKFKDATLRQVGPFNWIPREESTEIVREAMQPAIRFSRDECPDLPECTYITHSAQLTKEQEKAYKEMQNTLKTEIDGGEILAVNQAVKMSKLVQIACGVAYDINGKTVVSPAESRLKVTKDIIHSSIGKTIVYVPFVAAIESVADFLKSNGLKVGVISGSVSAGKRASVFKEFQDSDKLDVIVAQPAAMSHGLTLTEASTIIWFAPITSNDIYEQANGRITRPGQKNKQLIVNIEGSWVERHIYTRLENKQSLQGLLLDCIKES